MRAEPRTAPLLVIKAESVTATTDRARPMLTGQLALCQAKAEQQAGPLPEGNVADAKTLTASTLLRLAAAIWRDLIHPRISGVGVTAT